MQICPSYYLAATSPLPLNVGYLLKVTPAPCSHHSSTCCLAGASLTLDVRRSIQSAKTRPGADCGSDHERFIAKFRLKLKKVGKTTRPFRYDLNQIPYDYTVKVINRFKGLDLTDRVPEELWRRFVTLYREQGSKPPPRKRNAKKQNGCLKRPYK